MVRPPPLLLPDSADGEHEVAELQSAVIGTGRNHGIGIGRGYGIDGGAIDDRIGMERVADVQGHELEAVADHYCLQRPVVLADGEGDQAHSCLLELQLVGASAGHLDYVEVVGALRVNLPHLGQETGFAADCQLHRRCGCGRTLAVTSQVWSEGTTTCALGAMPGMRAIMCRPLSSRTGRCRPCGCIRSDGSWGVLCDEGADGGSHSPR